MLLLLTFFPQCEKKFPVCFYCLFEKANNMVESKSRPVSVEGFRFRILLPLSCPIRQLVCVYLPILFSLFACLSVCLTIYLSVIYQSVSVVYTQAPAGPAHKDTSTCFISSCFDCMKYKIPPLCKNSAFSFFFCRYQSHLS